MIKIMLTMNFISSTLFMFLNHPLSMGLILMIQTISISFITSMICLSSWFSYILFLIMIGGMLILFMYMTSIASNELLKLSNKLIMSSIMFLFIYMIMFKLPFMLKNNNNLMEFESSMMMIQENSFLLKKLYSNPNNLITLMIIFYLLITLIMSINITNMNMGPLRQKF
uniref:NADH-ubiquinone oxidoreductase chain 6 n=1 Tax=Meru phyllisae TaxID=535381 RepID=S4SVX2_9COLE|nr:NADH dehydrogenase subunit 6 [Meru phyllisae]